MRVVMCRPDFFEVKRRSQTNRRMNPESPPHRVLAIRQWDQLLMNYREHGLRVIVMDGQPDLHDMTFVANAGLPVRGHFILSNFLEKERKGETGHYREFFGKLYGYDKVISLSEKAIFEGQGDALFINDVTLLLGYGVRTNEQGVREVVDLISKIDPKIKVIPLCFHPLDYYKPDEELFYHLDTCLLYLKKFNVFLACTRTFTKEAIEELAKIGRIFWLRNTEAHKYLCNSVVIGDAIFTPYIDEYTWNSLSHNFGYHVVMNDMSEFLKSGGAVKCFTLEIYD